MQKVYLLACKRCGFLYGANGSDIHDRKCPQCQGGKAGERYKTANGPLAPPALRQHYNSVFRKIVIALRISKEVHQFAEESRQKVSAFQAPDFSEARERKATQQLFSAFYSAVMSARNSAWSGHSGKVSKVLPREPRKYLEQTRQFSRAMFYEFCDSNEIGRWVDRYLKIRAIAQYLIELDELHGGARRYFRDIHRSFGVQGLLSAVIKDKRLPGIGKMTARNSLRDAFGLDLAKPDVVLQRVFYNLGWIPRGEDRAEVFQAICEQIDGPSVGVVDHVFWVFGNEGGKQAWGVDSQFCSGHREKGYADCIQGPSCLCQAQCVARQNR